MSDSRAICTVDVLAARKRIDPAFLRRLGVRDDERGVVIPYPTLHDRRVRSRLRRYAETAHPTRWLDDGAVQGVYCSPKTVARAREVGELVVVEGESDCWTLWLHGIPALGVPGSTMTHLIERLHVERIERVYVTREPDRAGAAFVLAVAQQLRKVGFAGQSLTVDLHASHGFKDPSELHVDDPGRFLERWRAAVTLAAVPAVESQTCTQLGTPPLNLCDLRTVRFERVDWFEQNLIPRAELTLVNGDGGLGKTTAVLDLIARASVGSALPSGLQHSRPLRCLIVAEEDRHGLLRARLDVAGADHDHIRLVESVGEEREYLTFPQHTRALRDAIVSGGWDVVLIDALLNHLDDDINASKPQDMRRAARSLSDVTHETGATIVAVRHIGKAAGAASTRGFGSAEARNVCRSELTVGGHPDADGLIVIALSKANLSPDRSATMAFRLVSQHVRDDDGIETSIARVEWEAAPPKITADALLDKQQPAERSQSEAARDWLRELLGDGRRQRPADVMLEAKKAGFSDATIYRVRARAGIVSDLSGFPARAYWFLNEPMDSHVSQHGGLENPGKAENPCRPDGLWSEGESRLAEAVEWP